MKNHFEYSWRSFQVGREKAWKGNSKGRVTDVMIDWGSIADVQFMFFDHARFLSSSQTHNKMLSH